MTSWDVFPGYLYLLIFSVLFVSSITDVWRRKVYDIVWLVGAGLFVSMLLVSFGSFDHVGIVIFTVVGFVVAFLLLRVGKVGCGDFIGIVFLSALLGSSHFRGFTDHAFLDVFIVGFSVVIMHGLVLYIMKGRDFILKYKMPFMVYLMIGFLVHWLAVILIE